MFAIRAIRARANSPSKAPGCMETACMETAFSTGSISSRMCSLSPPHSDLNGHALPTFPTENPLQAARSRDPIIPAVDDDVHLVRQDYDLADQSSLRHVADVIGDQEVRPPMNRNIEKTLARKVERELKQMKGSAKPPNRFLLYRRHMAASLKHKNMKLTELSKHIAHLWKNESHEVRLYYTEIAAEVRRKHTLVHGDSYKHKKRLEKAYKENIQYLAAAAAAAAMEECGLVKVEEES
ncbi:hypothetical protein BC830DRAFT_171653 [Chytriomyces sp. MP71]|nr:hypothetical protein BC830DRAFT_171653 [Chytriomyces sp. MP71]